MTLIVLSLLSLVWLWLVYQSCYTGGGLTGLGWGLAITTWGAALYVGMSGG